MIDEWLFRACKATNKSYGLLSYVCNIETRLPRRLRIVAQRTAVILFPEREFGGAGVTIPIRMASSRYTAHVRKPAHTSRRSGV